MNRAAFLLLLLCLTTPMAFAAPPASEALTTTQNFYDGYMKTLNADADASAYVLKSAQVTADFKKAYKAFMKDPGSDPIICAQDYPHAGFTAKEPIINGDKATVTLASRDPSFQHSFKVFLKSGDKGWQIDGTTDLKPKS